MRVPFPFPRILPPYPSHTLDRHSSTLERTVYRSVRGFCETVVLWRLVFWVSFTVGLVSLMEVEKRFGSVYQQPRAGRSLEVEKRFGSVYQ